MKWTRDEQIISWLPRLQAHRGYWVGGLQQNSLESIAKAFELGYEMAEFDVRTTSEGELILFHDDFIEGVAILKTRLAELKKLTPITTLEQLFSWFRQTQGFKLNLEIKSKAIVNSAVEVKICALIQKYGLAERILISSFNPLSLFRVKRINAGIYRALLLTFKKEEGNNWIITSMIMNVFCKPHVLHLRFEDYSEIFRYLALKVPIVLWTVNEAEVFEKYKSEIHGIISDKITPDFFKKLN